MKFADIEKHLSNPRLNRYLSACGSRTRAVRLYKANVKLSQAFHPLLGTIEVVLRNNINDALTTHFADADWIINQRTGFMSSLTLAGTGFYLRRAVEGTTKELTKRRLAVTSGKIISEQNFGFWTDLFEPHHFGLIGASSINAFTNLPTGMNRNSVSTKLKEIRKFRNRINHNEPIILRRNLVDFRESTNVHASILQVFNWIDPKLVTWIAELDKVPQALVHCGRI